MTDYPTKQFPRYTENGTRSRYLEVKDAILDAVLRGEYAQDGRLPTEGELAKLYGVSRVTVRSALQSMVDEGLVVKKQGSGSYIKSMDEVIRNSGFSLVPLYKGMGSIEGSSECKLTIASDSIAARLKIPGGTQILQTFRTQHCGGQPAVQIVEHVPFHFFKVLPEKDEPIESINQFILTHCGIVLREVVTEITPLSGEETPFGPGFEHILRLEELFLDESNRPVVFSNYFINPTLVRYRIRRKI